MNKIVETYKYRREGGAGEPAIGFDSISRTLCVEQTMKSNRTKSRLYMKWSRMRREENSFFLKISLIAWGFNTVFNEEVRDGKIR